MPEPVNATEAVDPTVSRWQKEIARAQTYFQKWEKRGDKLLKLYKRQNDSQGNRKFAMLWANTEVLKPTVAARPPVPQVSRRFKDKDPVGRVASELLERCATYQCDQNKLWDTLQHVRDDLLLPGRGTAWVRYEVDFAADGVTKTAERAMPDYVYWKDFLHQPARFWEEVGWVAKRNYMTAKAGKERFKDKWKNVSLDHSSERDSVTSSDPTVSVEAKATVWEIWSKTDRKVYFMAQSAPELLEEGPPPLDFEGFWPCPKPIWATLTNDSLVPTPDYAYYQDQAEEIDDLTARIAHLTDQLKLVGLYAAGKGDASVAIEAISNPQAQNVLIPVESWAVISGQKGMADLILWWPAEVVSEVLTSCITLRNQLIQDTYQINGLSDIVRGATDPEETATAQQLKSQWGSIRVRDRQNAFAQFAKDTIKLICEVIAEQFDPQTMIQMANMMPEQPAMPAPMQGMPGASQPTEPAGPPAAVSGGPTPMPPVQSGPDPMADYQQKVQELQAAATLLRDEKLRCFRVDIETDSTIAPDEDAEKQRRNEFIGAIGTFLKDAMPIIAQAPQLLPMAKEMMLFTVRGYRAGRMMEDVIEKSLDAVEKAAAAAQQSGPPPDPKVALETKKWDEAEKAKVVAETEKTLADAKHAHIQAEIEPQRFMQEQAMGEQEMGLKGQEVGLKGQDQQMQHQQMAKDNEFKDRELGMQERTASFDEAAKRTEMMRSGMAQPKLPPEPLPDPMQVMGDQFSQIGQGIQQLAQMLQMMNAGMDQLAQIVSAPVEVVRGPDGRVSHAQKVMPQRAVN